MIKYILFLLLAVGSILPSLQHNNDTPGPCSMPYPSPSTQLAPSMGYAPLLSPVVGFVRISSIHWRDAKGPCPARHIMQSLWRGEEYYLQIDSHMRFVKGWDTKLRGYLAQTGNPRAILTSYPVGYEQPNMVPSYKNPAFLVAKGFDPTDGMLRLEGKLLKNFSEKEPVKSCFWVSGFAFSRADVIKEVPYDPHLRHLFFGEEMLMCARLWTHGWDFSCPGQNIIYHLWDRSYRKTFREIVDPKKVEMETISKLRVWKILGMEPFISGESREKIEKSPQLSESIVCEIEKYGLGQVRTLENYQDFCGVNFKERKVFEKGKLGGGEVGLFLDTIIEFVLKQSKFVSLDTVV